MRTCSRAPPPFDPFPEVVGISVHLTFAKRGLRAGATGIAPWERRSCSGGCTCCPARTSALRTPMRSRRRWRTALAADPRGRGGRHAAAGISRRRMRATIVTIRRRAATILPPRAVFSRPPSLIATRGCHNRCGFCYLATEGCACRTGCRDPRAGGRASSRLTGSPTPCLSTTISALSAPIYASSARRFDPLEKIWSAAVTIDVTDDPVARSASMALAGCTGVFIGFESLNDENLGTPQKRTPSCDDYARRVAILHENGIQVNGSFVLGFDHDRRDVFARTMASWIEENRLECATFHILTPYPAHAAVSPDGSGGSIAASRLGSYDTAHACLPAQAHDGRGVGRRAMRWMYERLFSHTSIWRRRPRIGERCAVSRDVVSLQALESLLAPADQTPSCSCGVVGPRGTYRPGPYAFEKNWTRGNYPIGQGSTS